MVSDDLENHMPKNSTESVSQSQLSASMPHEPVPASVEESDMEEELSWEEELPDIVFKRLDVAKEAVRSPEYGKKRALFGRQETQFVLFFVIAGGFLLICAGILASQKMAGLRIMADLHRFLFRKKKIQPEE